MNSLKIVATALTFGLTSAVGASAQEGAPASSLEIDRASVLGGGGGHYESERPIYLNAPVSRVCVCAGSVIDSIQFVYGNQSGIRIGGGGGVCSDWQLKQGQKNVSVKVRHGNLIDGVEFETVNPVERRKFGGNGGSLTILKGTNGGPLAFVEGAGGNHVDRLRFVFGASDYHEQIGYQYSAPVQCGQSLSGALPGQ